MSQKWLQLLISDLAQMGFKLTISTFHTPQREISSVVFENENGRPFKMWTPDSSLIKTREGIFAYAHGFIDAKRE